MGKVTGFMELDRVERDYEPVEDRIKHFKEFLIPLDQKKVSEQSARCMDCGIPYCHQGCPVNNLIPDWNDLKVGLSHLLVIKKLLRRLLLLVLGLLV